MSQIKNQAPKTRLVDADKDGQVDSHHGVGCMVSAYHPPTLNVALALPHSPACAAGICRSQPHLVCCAFSFIPCVVAGIHVSDVARAGFGVVARAAGTWHARNAGRLRGSRFQLGDHGCFSHGTHALLLQIPCTPLDACERNRMAQSRSANHMILRNPARSQVNHLSFGPFLSERAWMVLPPHIAAAVGTLDDHAFTSDQHIPTTHEHYVKVRASKSGYQLCMSICKPRPGP
jgi:hypothetical protein